MQQTTSHQEASSFASSRRSTQYHSQRTRFLDWREVRRSLSQFRQRLRRTMHIWRGSLGSFFGHIRIQSPTERVGVYLGPEFLKPTHAGCLELNPRTIARDEYTRALLATYSWADIADLRVFLMGFDAGEEWSHDSMGIVRKEHPCEFASWLDPTTRNYGYVPDMVRQRIKEFSGQTQTPFPESSTS
jgi:hypothetical protein